jgi:hypothetical protein
VDCKGQGEEKLYSSFGSGKSMIGLVDSLHSFVLSCCLKSFWIEHAIMDVERIYPATNRLLLNVSQLRGAYM